MNGSTYHPANRRSRTELIRRIEELDEKVRQLRGRVDELTDEREQLLEENRALRQELTEFRLLNHLEQSVAEVDEKAESMRAVPSLTERLYQALPPSFSFPAYFQVAENKDVDMEAARRCLRHFLAEKRVVREGSRLRKEKESFSERNQGGDGRSSRLSM